VKSEASEIDCVFLTALSLCRAEIGYYRRKDQAGSLCFVDVAESRRLNSEGMTQQRAMERFQCSRSDGRVLSGAAAFVEVLDSFAEMALARAPRLCPGVLAVLELGYRMFLPVRPFLSRRVGRVLICKR